MDAGDHFKNGASLKSHKSKRYFSLYKLLILFVLSMFLFSSCEQNEMDGDMDDNAAMHDYRVHDVLYAKGSKLKQISSIFPGFSEKEHSYKQFPANSETMWYVDADYEYDNSGRISKISRPMYEDGKINGVISYNIYTYNAKNQLEKNEYYNANLYAGFLILATYTYSYDKDGKKVKEVVEYPHASPFRTDSTLYYYDNNRLKREDKYEDGYFGREPWRSELIAYIEYEYDNQGNPVKETHYSGTDDALLTTVVHNYQDGLNVKTEVYNNYFQNDKMREIRRYYDENDNLIYLESDELSIYSSSLSFVSKYEYY
jgi:hypothetical protein